MSEPRPGAGLSHWPSRAELRSLLREQVAELGGSLRIAAEEVLCESSTVDLVTVDATGSAVLVLIGDEGEDAELFTRALALRSWVRARLRDWAQLAPGLGLCPDAPVRAILLCPAFDPETVSAARDLGEGSPELRLVRVLGDGVDGHRLLVEPLRGLAVSRTPRRPGQTREPAPFRSGLSDADLNLTAQERRDLE